MLAPQYQSNIANYYCCYKNPLFKYCILSLKGNHDLYFYSTQKHQNRCKMILYIDLLKEWVFTTVPLYCAQIQITLIWRNNPKSSMKQGRSDSFILMGFTTLGFRLSVRFIPCFFLSFSWDMWLLIYHNFFFLSYLGNVQFRKGTILWAFLYKTEIFTWLIFLSNYSSLFLNVERGIYSTMTWQI